MQASIFGACPNPG